MSPSDFDDFSTIQVPLWPWHYHNFTPAGHPDHSDLFQCHPSRRCESCRRCNPIEIFPRRGLDDFCTEEYWRRGEGEGGGGEASSKWDYKVPAQNSEQSEEGPLKLDGVQLDMSSRPKPPKKMVSSGIEPLKCLQPVPDTSLAPLGIQMEMPVSHQFEMNNCKVFPNSSCYICSADTDEILMYCSIYDVPQQQQQQQQKQTVLIVSERKMVTTCSSSLTNSNVDKTSSNMFHSACQSSSINMNSSYNTHDSVPKFQNKNSTTFYQMENSQNFSTTNNVSTDSMYSKSCLHMFQQDVNVNNFTGGFNGGYYHPNFHEFSEHQQKNINFPETYQPSKHNWKKPPSALPIQTNCQFSNQHNFYEPTSMEHFCQNPGMWQRLSSFGPTSGHCPFENRTNNNHQFNSNSTASKYYTYSSNPSQSSVPHPVNFGNRPYKNSYIPQENSNYFIKQNAIQSCPSKLSSSGTRNYQNLESNISAHERTKPEGFRIVDQEDFSLNENVNVDVNHDVCADPMVATLQDEEIFVNDDDTLESLPDLAILSTTSELSGTNSPQLISPHSVPIVKTTSFELINSIHNESTCEQSSTSNRIMECNSGAELVQVHAPLNKVSPVHTTIPEHEDNEDMDNLLTKVSSTTKLSMGPSKNRHKVKHGKSKMDRKTNESKKSFKATQRQFLKEQLTEKMDHVKNGSNRIKKSAGIDFQQKVGKIACPKKAKDLSCSNSNSNSTRKAKTLAVPTGPNERMPLSRVEKQEQSSSKLLKCAAEKLKKVSEEAMSKFKETQLEANVQTDKFELETNFKVENSTADSNDAQLDADALDSPGMEEILTSQLVNFIEAMRAAADSSVGGGQQDIHLNVLCPIEIVHNQVTGANSFTIDNSRPSFVMADCISLESNSTGSGKGTTGKTFIARSKSSSTTSASFKGVKAEDDSEIYLAAIVPSLMEDEGVARRVRRPKTVVETKPMGVQTDSRRKKKK